ncbi:hypothetical protein YYE_04763 [Plasmodium vinckei vinckei]|uniref:Uncharacterized protein n=1 Tax=Plasmodium vinckei vinckei TaxID=54757 RepID=A0A081I994_PLAVN|nr:hypothetical protein YYE_04763 [Plasmodium vinckei vinckei]
MDYVFLQSKRLHKNYPSILRISRDKNSQFVTLFTLRATRVLGELSQSEIFNTHKTGIIQNESDIEKENEKHRLFKALVEASKSSQDKDDPYNIKTKLKAFKYGVSVKNLIKKLEGFVHVDYVVNELQKDHSIKQLLVELQDFNGFYDLIIVLKYSDDPELNKLLFTSNNLEKLLFVLNYFNNACKFVNGEYVLDDGRSIGRSMHKKKPIPVLSFLFKIINNFYDKIMLSGALKLYKTYKLGSWVNKVASTIVFLSKMLIPVTMGVTLVVMLSYLKGIVYYITSVTIIVLSLAYVLDKAVKSYNYVSEKYQFIPLELQIELNMDSVD